MNWLLTFKNGKRASFLVFLKKEIGGVLPLSHFDESWVLHIATDPAWPAARLHGPRALEFEALGLGRCLV